LKEPQFFLSHHRLCGILTTTVEDGFDSFVAIIALCSTEADDCAWVGQDAGDLPLRDAGFFVDFVNILIWLAFDEAAALANSLKLHCTSGWRPNCIRALDCSLNRLVNPKRRVS
jgi:hypothetical protein